MEKASVHDINIALGRAMGLPLIEIEVPVNMCPDDDPRGERPTKKAWGPDVNAMSLMLMEHLEIFRKEEA